MSILKWFKDKEIFKKIYTFFKDFWIQYTVFLSIYGYFLLFSFINKKIIALLFIVISILWVFFLVRKKMLTFWKVFVMYNAACYYLLDVNTLFHFWFILWQFGNFLIIYKSILIQKKIPVYITIKSIILSIVILFLLYVIESMYTLPKLTGA